MDSAKISDWMQVVGIFALVASLVFVGILWAMSTYTFIVTFRSVPEKADSNLGIFGKVKRRLHRSWYWVISIVFLGTTAAAIYFTYSVISIWARDYSV